MKITKQILLFIVAFTSIMILSEIFIRTTYLSNVSSTEFYDDIGRGRRKNLKYLYFNEGFGIGKFNEYRYIGEVNPPKKPNETIRIALLGDSYVESFQVFERNYFGNIAENILSKRYPEKHFEILNFGRSGYDIGNNYAYQKTFVDNFDPDYILYMVSNGDLNPKKTDPLRPQTIIRNDSLKVSFDFKPSEIIIFENTKFLTQNSSILNMLNNGRKKTKETPLSAILLEKLYTWISPLNNQLKSEDNLEYQINPVTKKIVESLDSKKVIFINRGMQEFSWEFQKLYSDNGFIYFDLSKTLNLMKEQGIDPNEWKVTKKRGHWNPKAHKVIGIEIAREIEIVIENELKILN